LKSSGSLATASRLKGLSTAHKLVLLAVLQSRTVGEAYRNFYELARSHGFPGIEREEAEGRSRGAGGHGLREREERGGNYFVELSKWPQDVVEVLKRALPLNSLSSEALHDQLPKLRETP